MSDRNAERGARSRDETRFREDMTQKVDRPRSETGPDDEVAVPRGRVHEEQVAEVRARDQENQQRHTLEQEQSWLELGRRGRADWLR